jgi:hypothetical protein
LDLKLANNPTPEEKPKVSKLPLPISDSPLVIDLPDGQKIVVGKMIQGSVIEVATWRGVGRPDSRTSRLMLGVGNGNVNEDQSASAQGQFAGSTKPVKPKDWRVVLYYLAMAINGIKSIPLKKLMEKISPAVLIKKFPSKPKVKREINKTDTPSTQPSSAENKSTSTLTQVDDDIEAWLNKISEKASQKSAAAKTPSKSPAKKSAPVKKTTKRAATSKAKR